MKSDVPHVKCPTLGKQADYSTQENKKNKLKQRMQTKNTTHYYKENSQSQY